MNHSLVVSGSRNPHWFPPFTVGVRSLECECQLGTVLAQGEILSRNGEGPPRRAHFERCATRYLGGIDDWLSRVIVSFSIFVVRDSWICCH